MSGIKNRINEVRTNNFGSIMKIVHYKNNCDIDIFFPQYNWTYKHCSYDSFKRGNVKCPYEPRYQNMGYLGDGRYDAVTHKYIFDTWRHMLRRCYDEKEFTIHPTYKDCEVCTEWLNFQNFAKWYDENYYEVENEKMNLDKDILFKNNKIYSPHTCIFVPQKINTLFVKKNMNRGMFPIGVHFRKDKNKFSARCSNNKGRYIHLGYFNDQIDAFKSYKNFKENIIKEVADSYKDKIPVKLYESMYKYEVEITD